MIRTTPNWGLLCSQLGRKTVKLNFEDEHKNNANKNGLNIPRNRYESSRELTLNLTRKLIRVLRFYEEVIQARNIRIQSSQIPNIPYPDFQTIDRIHSRFN